MELYVGVHHDASEIAMTRSEPDLLVEFSVARDHGLSLVGPGAAAVIGAVPSAWILNYSDLVLERWEELVDDGEHGELMVFTACRIWRYAEEGVHSSKIAAAHWALRRDSSLGAVQQALLRRRGDRAARIDPRDLSRLLQRVRSLCTAPLPPTA
jgi:hypothetical protein